MPNLKKRSLSIWPDGAIARRNRKSYRAALRTEGPDALAALRALTDFAEQYGGSSAASATDWSGYIDSARKALAKFDAAAAKPSDR